MGAAWQRERQIPQMAGTATASARPGTWAGDCPRRRDKPSTIGVRQSRPCRFAPVQKFPKTIVSLIAVVLIAVACGTSEDTATLRAPTQAPATADASTAQPASTATPTAATPTASSSPAASTATPTASSSPAASTATPTAVPTVAAVAPAPAPSTPVPSAPTAAPTPATSELATGAAIIAVLDSLTVESEHTGSGFVRADFEHHSGYLCDSPGTDPYTGVSYDPSSCDVDHVVAAQEAFESGGWEWAVSRREAFGNDTLNLVPTRDCVNRSKGARDMAEWSGRIGSGTCEGLATTRQGRCYMASKAVEVKAAYSLSVDASEKNALAEAIGGCPPGGPAEPSGPSEFQTAGPTPPPTQAASEPATSGSDCHPAYSPCLPNLPGDALNCGDLTAAQRPVTVLTPGTDPYRLDRDGDGRGCTS